ETYVGIEAIVIAEDIQKHAFNIWIIYCALNAEGLLCAHLQFHLTRLSATKRHPADIGHLRAVHIDRSSARRAAGILGSEIRRTSCVIRSRSIRVARNWHCALKKTRAENSNGKSHEHQ